MKILFENKNSFSYLVFLFFTTVFIILNLAYNVYMYKVIRKFMVFKKINSYNCLLEKIKMLLFSFLTLKLTVVCSESRTKNKIDEVIKPLLQRLQ